MSTIGLRRALLQGDDCCGELVGVGKAFLFLAELGSEDWPIFSLSSMSANRTDFRGVLFLDAELRLIAYCVISCSRREDAFDLGEKNRLKRRGVIGGGFFGLPAPDEGVSVRRLGSMTRRCGRRSSSSHETNGSDVNLRRSELP